MHTTISFLVSFIISRVGSTVISGVSVGANWVNIAQSAAYHSNGSSECVESLKLYGQVLSQQNFTGETQWALQMLDASGKIPAAILYGALTDFGNFDECLAVAHPAGRFTGQYCLLDIHPPAGYIHQPKEHWNIPNRPRKGAGPGIPGTQSISWGVCLPSSCSIEDMRKVFNNATLKDIFNVVRVDENSCWTSEAQQFSSGSWAFISVGIVLITLAVISTMYETYTILMQQDARPNKLLTSFSVYRNARSLLDIRPSSGVGDMGCLHGIRALSMMWVLQTHTILFQTMMPALNIQHAVAIQGSVEYTFFNNSWFSVDSFLLVSGLLVAFVFFRNISSTGYFDVPFSYVHRYLRLTPVFLAMILFHITLLKELSQGPIYHKVTVPEGKACKDYWWSSLLYVQNYINPTETCIGQSWYLSVDMQLYWLSPLILYPLYLRPKLGAVFLGLLTLASALWTFVIGYVGGFRATTATPRSANGDVILDQYAQDFVATHTRIIPWLVGIALGFAICAIKARKDTIRLTKVQVITGWLLSAGVCLGCLYGARRFFDYPSASDTENALYLSFSRLGWGLGLSWVVFACIYGYGGVANSFLSLAVFQLLGKLSYNVYLVHETILIYICATTRTKIFSSDFNVVLQVLGVFLLSNLIAALLYLLVEAPFANLDNHFLGNLRILPWPTNTKVNASVSEKTTKMEIKKCGDIQNT